MSVHMNMATTRMSAKGQVVIPKHLRDRLDFTPGTELSIEETEDGLLLRPARKPGARLTLDEFIARRPTYSGPAVSIEEMNAAVGRGIAEQWEQEERARRDR